MFLSKFIDISKEVFDNNFAIFTSSFIAVTVYLTCFMTPNYSLESIFNFIIIYLSLMIGNLSLISILTVILVYLKEKFNK